MITQQIPTARAVRDSFSGFAGVYDLYTAHPDYASWVSGLVRLGEAHMAGGHRALDLGCGTGNSTVPLLDLGYDVTAVDCVPEMLALAHTKTGGRARFVEHDLVELPRLGAFDLVLCLNDVVNYLLTADDLRRALRGVAANVAPGGVLVFDANTLRTFRDTFATSHERTQGELTFVWHGHAAPDFTPGGIARADLLLGELTSVHLQRHHPREEIAAALDAAGLALVTSYGQFADGRREDFVDEARHLKAVHVARRSTGTEREGVT